MKPVRLSITLLLLGGALFSAASAQAASVRIVAYGDSGVAGKGVAANQAYPVQLQEMLRQKGIEATVINKGVNGGTSSDALASLEASIPAGTDIAIVQFGVNDTKHGISAEQVRRNIDQLVSRLRARGIGILVVGYPSADLSGVASAHGAAYVRWGGLPDPKYHVPGDPNNHFNAAGLGVMASRMLPAVEKLIGAKR